MGTDIQWEAILKRDVKADGRFVYAVRSTGIYCRPSCASRKPKRENVVIFKLPEMAEESGFRPCLRCFPQNAAYDPRFDKIRRAICYLEERVEESPTLKEVGRAVGMSPHHLQRRFKQALGVTPRQYLESLKLRKYKSLIKNGRDLAGACYKAGYGSSSRVYERASHYMGMTPGAYQKGGEGISIQYGVAECRLGKLLVAATEKGVCWVSVGETIDTLIRSMQSEFPKANLRRNDHNLKKYLKVVAGLAEGEARFVSLPVDVRASTFQCRVWERLKSIPLGMTTTYKEIAGELGLPGGARAVGRACAQNPVALLVPCHRVVREDGCLAGYRWGVERKRKLLDMEKKSLKTIDYVERNEIKLEPMKNPSAALGGGDECI